MSLPADFDSNYFNRIIENLKASHEKNIVKGSKVRSDFAGDTPVFYIVKSLEPNDFSVRYDAGASGVGDCRGLTHYIEHLITDNKPFSGVSIGGSTNAHNFQIDTFIDKGRKNIEADAINDSQLFRDPEYSRFEEQKPYILDEFYLPSRASSFVAYMASSVHFPLGSEADVSACRLEDIKDRARGLKNYISHVSVVGHNARKIVNRLKEDDGAGIFGNDIEPIKLRDADQVYVGILNGQCHAAFNIGTPTASETVSIKYFISKVLDDIKQGGIYNVGLECVEPHYFGVRDGKPVSNGVLVFSTSLGNFDKAVRIAVNSMAKNIEFNYVDFYRDFVIGEGLLSRKIKLIEDMGLKRGTLSSDSIFPFYEKITNYDYMEASVDSVVDNFFYTLPLFAEKLESAGRYYEAEIYQSKGNNNKRHPFVIA